jgi:hypothetical protein
MKAIATEEFCFIPSSRAQGVPRPDVEPVEVLAQVRSTSPNPSDCHQPSRAPFGVDRGGGHRLTDALRSAKSLQPSPTWKPGMPEGGRRIRVVLLRWRPTSPAPRREEVKTARA